MPSFMTSEDSIPCSTPLAEKLMQVIMATDSKALEADQPATGLSVDVLHGEIYIYADADELFMESVENSDIPKVVGEILTEAGLPFLHCGVGWNENKAAAGPTSGGYFFRFLASGEIDFAKARLFPSDEWIWHCPNCGKTTIHDYDALAAVPASTWYGAQVLRTMSTSTRMSAGLLTFILAIATMMATVTFAENRSLNDLAYDERGSLCDVYVGCAYLLRVPVPGLFVRSEKMSP